MRLGGSRRSGNIEDRRGMGMGRGAGIGVGTVVLLIVGYFMGINPATLLNLADVTQQEAPQAQGPTGAPADEAGDFVAAVLGETEDVWSAIFSAQGAQYPAPTLTLFSGRVSSACGSASSASGPFYCPGDRKVYIDLEFFNQLATEFGAPGDFARAYVIAHEVGHHVQTLTGASQRVQQVRERSPQDANRAQMALELQADCYAGVWAQRADSARQILETGDVEEGLAAAAAVGDDTLQRRMQGTVVPDSFTHGSAAQRTRWFRRGLESGDPGRCNTFDGAAL